MQHQIFKTKRVGWYGQLPLGEAQLRELRQDSERKAKRIEDAIKSDKEESRETTQGKFPFTSIHFASADGSHDSVDRRILSFLMRHPEEKKTE